MGSEGGEINVISGLTLTSGTTSGSTNVYLISENFDELDGTSDFTFNSIEPSGLTVQVTSIFATSTPTPTSTVT